MERRTKAMYDAVWRELLRLCPSLARNVTFFMSDYERAMVESAAEALPNAAIHGCWYHFVAALCKYWYKRLRLRNAPDTVLRMMMALPLAPLRMWDEGLTIIQDQADQDAARNGYVGILQFMAYVRRQWHPLRERINCFAIPARTNNTSETGNSRLRRALGLRENIWMFLGTFIKLD